MKEKQQQWRISDGQQAQVRLTISLPVQVVPPRAA